MNRWDRQVEDFALAAVGHLNNGAEVQVVPKHCTQPTRKLHAWNGRYPLHGATARSTGLLRLAERDQFDQSSRLLTGRVDLVVRLSVLGVALADTAMDDPEIREDCLEVIEQRGCIQADRPPGHARAGHIGVECESLEEAEHHWTR